MSENEWVYVESRVDKELEENEVEVKFREMEWIE